MGFGAKRFGGTKSKKSTTERKFAEGQTFDLCHNEVCAETRLPFSPFFARVGIRNLPKLRRGLHERPCGQNLKTSLVASCPSLDMTARSQDF
jgi:hypothetical protein